MHGPHPNMSIPPLLHPGASSESPFNRVFGVTPKGATGGVRASGRGAGWDGR
jgi:hypothetical protein